jgi:hypothetical protein
MENAFFYFLVVIYCTGVVVSKFWLPIHMSDVRSSEYPTKKSYGKYTRVFGVVGISG